MVWDKEVFDKTETGARARKTEIQEMALQDHALSLARDKEGQGHLEMSGQIEHHH
ncbi:hypothetical protein DPMN_021321 [Dreissena polymorpha]|uniref:Uncharacterized protein n=1 Tax=Dreissena polymorpha TaxID=45954 RepID=A0A9D4S9V4_DREPO|nr:hypothetical protein DPMN_021321 [Dreissena polymorpha]